MGVVHIARDTQLNRSVAIKVLPPDRLSDPERKRRFIQEARAASALNHPGIVTIYDIGSEGAVDFIVMGYAAGKVRLWRPCQHLRLRAWLFRRMATFFFSHSLTRPAAT